MDQNGSEHVKQFIKEVSAATQTQEVPEGSQTTENSSQSDPSY